MDLGFDVVVTVTGIVLVFLILVLLMAIITLEGKIFDGLGKKKAAASKPAAPAKPAAPVQQAAAPAPQVEEGIPGDVVAAIMAAIHAMGNGKYTLRAVRRGTNGWGKAGVNDTTAPF